MTNIDWGMPGPMKKGVDSWGSSASKKGFGDWDEDNRPQSIETVGWVPSGKCHTLPTARI